MSSAAALLRIVSLLVALVASGPMHAEQAMDCKTGPVTKTYGRSDWLVYSCTDGKSVVFVSAEGSPASPFYFILTPTGLHGEGTGNKNASDAAYEDIGKLTDADVRALIQETRSVHN